MNQAAGGDQATPMDALMNVSFLSIPGNNEDVTPVAHNKSEKSSSHPEERSHIHAPSDKSERAQNICVNLDESKFSISNLPPARAEKDMFVRKFTPGNNSPFSEDEGMLATWRARPQKKVSPKVVTVQEAWIYGLTKIEPVPSGKELVSYSFVFAELECINAPNTMDRPVLLLVTVIISR